MTVGISDTAMNRSIETISQSRNSTFHAHAVWMVRLLFYSFHMKMLDSLELPLLRFGLRRFEIRIAVPLLGRDVAPRFGYADRFLLAEILDGKISRMDLESIVVPCFASRLGKLQDLKVEVVVCCGFDRAFIPLAEALGIRIIFGVVGAARNAVLAFASGEALPTLCCNKRNRPNRKRRGAGQGRCRSSGKQQKKNKGGCYGKG
jgi:predicted Fe-Mo cluster-binding NifX family protein